MLAIDAINYKDPIDQFKSENINKEIIKCLAGFQDKSRVKFKSLATGKIN